MTSFGLRVAAVITMLVDHVGVCVLACTPYQTLGTVMRSIGRMSFPLFAFLVVTGCAHTRSRRRYFGRMMALAVLSQLPYAIFTGLFSHPAAPVEGIVISWLPAGEMLGRLLLAAVCLWCWWSRYNERGLGDPVGWLLCAALGVMACPVSLRWGWLTLPGELNIFYQLGLGIYLFFGGGARRAGGGPAGTVAAGNPGRLPVAGRIRVGGDGAAGGAGILPEPDKEPGDGGALVGDLLSPGVPSVYGIARLLSIRSGDGGGSRARLPVQRQSRSANRPSLLLDLPIAVFGDFRRGAAGLFLRVPARGD